MLSETPVTEATDLWPDLLGNVQNKKNKTEGKNTFARLAVGMRGIFPGCWSVPNLDEANGHTAC